MTEQVQTNERRDERVAATVFRQAVWVLLQILAEIARFHRDGG
jgi:hypothetical protein